MPNYKNSDSLFKTLLSGISNQEKRNFKVFGYVVFVAVILGVLIFEYPRINKLFVTQTPPAEKKITVPSQTFNFVGKISKIEKNILELKGLSETKNITVTPETIITKMTFTQVFSDGKKRFVSEERTVSISTLKTGLNVEALASNAINKADEFTAVHVRILP